MKLLFVADSRSPIALNWIAHFAHRSHEVHLVSMYPGHPDLHLASYHTIPVAFSGAVGESKSQDAGGIGAAKARLLRFLAPPRIRTWLRQRFIPLSLPKAALQLRTLIHELEPDLIHAMRVPYEGMLASLALPDENGPPLLISIWGNDFTLHAPSTQKMTALTYHALKRADALHTDCYRDQRLATAWGFNAKKPGVVIPGSGGVQLDLFYPKEEVLDPVVINPRGLRAYVRNDTFFQAIPMVLSRHPQSRFVCPAMEGQPEAERWVKTLGLESAVQLLPRQPRKEMAALFQNAQVVVSPSTHDGTPNTLLEAMACGCFPVVGDIESLREWITPGVNGLLVDPTDPKGLADAICEGLQNPHLRARSKERNAHIIAERADYRRVMASAEAFYDTIMRSSTPTVCATPPTGK